MAAADAADDETRPALRDAIGASWICAIPWLAAFVIDRTAAGGVLGSNLPPLAPLLMGSLIVTGGFVHAMTCRARFYLGIGQPGFAAFICG